MDVMNIVSIVGILIVAFLAGCDGVLDQFQFHQPIVSCTLIGLITGHPAEGIMLGGSLQLIALGWMNIGAAVAPDAALAGVASAIFVCYQQSLNTMEAVAVAIPLAVAGLVLTTLVRSIAVGILHAGDVSAQKGSAKGIAAWTMLALCLQGLRIVIPAALLLAAPASLVTNALNAVPGWFITGLTTAGGFIVVVGYAMVINMMASAKIWPFFFMGFALASVTELGLIAMGIIGVCIALIYLDLSPEFNGGGTAAAAASGASGDILDDILNDYE